MAAQGLNTDHLHSNADYKDLYKKLQESANYNGELLKSSKKMNFYY